MSVYRSSRQPDRVHWAELEAIPSRAKLLRAFGRCTKAERQHKEGGQLTIVVELCADCETTSWLG